MGSGLKRAFGMSRKFRSVGLSQGPGATFPEMSQTPAISGVSRTKAGYGKQHCRWRRGVSRHCWNWGDRQNGLGEGCIICGNLLGFPA